MYCMVPDKGQNSTNIHACAIGTLYSGIECYWILVQGCNLNPLSEREVDHGMNCR